MGKKHKQQKKGGAPDKPVNAPMLWQDGLAHFQQGDYPKAAAEWHKIPSAQRSPQIVAALGEAHFRRGLGIYRQPDFAPEKNCEQIISELAHALNLLPQNPRYHFHLGLAYHHQGKLDKAVAAYRKAWQLQREPKYLLHLILALLKKKDLQQAEESLKLFPEGFQKNLCAIVAALLKKQTPGAMGSGAEATPAEKKLFAGLLLCLEARPHDAIPRFEQALISSPPDHVKSISHYYLGLARRAVTPDQPQASEKNWEEALNAGLRRAGIAQLHINANLFTMLWEQGLRSAGAGKYVAACLAWERALTLKPNHPALLRNFHRVKFLLGNEAARRGDWSEALKLWQTVPLQSNVNLFHNIGVAYDQLQKPREANAHWLEVIKYWKKEYRAGADKNWRKDYLMIAHKHLARNCIALDDSRGAIRELQEVLRYDPNEAGCHQQIGDLHAEMEDWPQARREFEIVLRHRPNDIDAALSFAFALEMDDETEQARAMLKKILQAEPNHGRAKKQLGALLHDSAHEHWDEGEDDEAEALFKEQIKLDPANFDGYKCLAELMLEDDWADEKEVEAILQNYLAADSGNPSAPVAVGVVFLQADHRKLAEKYFKQAEQIGVTDPGMLMAIGKAYLQVSESKAKTYFDRAVKAAPGDAKFCFALGAELALEHPALSLEYLQKSLKIDGSNAEVYAELGLLHNILGNRREADKACFMAKQLASQQGNQELVKMVTAMQKEINQLQGMFGFLQEL